MMNSLNEDSLLPSIPLLNPLEMGVITTSALHKGLQKAPLGQEGFDLSSRFKISIQ
jgi:hypothetical protein